MATQSSGMVKGYTDEYLAWYKNNIKAWILIGLYIEKLFEGLHYAWFLHPRQQSQFEQLFADAKGKRLALLVCGMKGYNGLSWSGIFLRFQVKGSYRVVLPGGTLWVVVN